MVIITRHLAINMRTFTQHNELTRTLIQTRSIPNLVLELDIIDKTPWIMFKYHQGLLETDDTFGRELTLNRREWWRAVGGGRGGEAG